jgi:acetyl esterase/lipase
MKSYCKNLWLIMMLTSVGYLAFAKEISDNKNKRRFLDPVFESVSIQKDIVFGESVNEKGETEKLKLDIYSPDGDKMKNRPVIVWIHGGGFRPGNDKTQSYIVEMANRFSRKGYVCLSIDYRVRENPRKALKVQLQMQLRMHIKLWCG